MAKIELQRDLIKPKQTQDRILELIYWLEDNQSKIIKWHDAFSPTFLIVIAVFIAIAWTINTIQDYALSLGIAIAGFSALIAYFSFVIQTSKNSILEKRYRRVKKRGNFSDKDIVLTRALMKIKSKNHDIDLKTLYNMDKEANGEMFTEKNLIELLCK